MADEDDKEPPEPPPPRPRNQQQQMGWLDNQHFDPPRQQRNPALYNQPPAFAHVPPTDAERNAATVARFEKVERLSAELTAEIALLREVIAEQATPEIGIGHNQGPPITPEELEGETTHLIALLKEKGPRPTSADKELIADQAKKALQVSEQIKTWLHTLTIEAVKLGAREVAKDLTAPLWSVVALVLAEFAEAILEWLKSLL
jgi:hypothetical protein